MANEEVEDFLAHYGVLGMKWGVRRSRAQLDRAAARRGEKRAAKKASQSEDHNRARALSKKPASQLTNKELSDLNQRLNLEKNYSALKASQTTVSRGNQAAKSVLAVGTTATAAYTMYKSPAGQALKSVVNNAMTRAAYHLVKDAL